MLAAVSVDLDEIPNYFAIHGLTSPPSCATAVYDIAVPRLLELAETTSIPLTLFAIGSDLDRGANRSILREARGRGHEVANHSLDHLYDLIRRSPTEMRAQVRGGADAIERAVGERPRGFRAPGYTVSDALFEVLAEEGATYDSSVFPCPPYYGVKSLALARIRLARRRSRSILDTPNVLRAPRRPYRVGRPYWRRGGGLLELPIQVTRWTRAPVIGTTLVGAGPRGARWLLRGVIGEPFVNLELHGIDVLDEQDGLQSLRDHQADVRVALRTKRAALRTTVEALRSRGYRFVTLAEAARHFGSVISGT